MSDQLSMRWAGEDEIDAVARARWLSYGHALHDEQKFLETLQSDPRAVPGDYLLAEDAGKIVGTATSLSMTMWARGASFPCQGIADVGAIKTQRRRGKPGVASQIMHGLLRKARDREQVVSALMPFRASFYEHFGFGIAEHRAVWNVPVSLLPDRVNEGWEIATADDVPGLLPMHSHMVQQGQCTIDRTAEGWSRYLSRDRHGMRFVRKIEGRIDAHVYWQHAHERGKDILKVEDWGAWDGRAFGMILSFLSSLKDQYHCIIMQLPVDLPLNLLLKETQLPHRPVNHAHAELKIITRMQMRILNHARWLESLNWPESTRGSVNVRVMECDEKPSHFCLEIDAGRAAVKPATCEPDFACSSATWASIASGDLPASTAWRMGLADASLESAMLLRGLYSGRRPFCHEYF